MRSYDESMKNMEHQELEVRARRLEDGRRISLGVVVYVEEARSPPVAGALRRVCERVVRSPGRTEQGMQGRVIRWMSGSAWGRKLVWSGVVEVLVSCRQRWCLIG